MVYGWRKARRRGLLGSMEIRGYAGYAEDRVRSVSIPKAPVDGPLADVSVTERLKVMKASETTLHKAVLKIVTIVNQYKDHIPPITTSEVNPFPYQITLNPRLEGWNKNTGLY